MIWIGSLDQYKHSKNFLFIYFTEDTSPSSIPNGCRTQCSLLVRFVRFLSFRDRIFNWWRLANIFRFCSSWFMSAVFGLTIFVPKIDTWIMRIICSVCCIHFHFFQFQLLTTILNTIYGFQNVIFFCYHCITFIKHLVYLQFTPLQNRILVIYFIFVMTNFLLAYLN